ncbi:Hypothetical predicted protein [Pelobates cultripes]|uniref:Uncharacterized protein n=1 Tax=Pelobates cultripes TaxID=61616 RepID=A0AAD1W0G5_PELCU|nr:Hypothetical predicted protein [Pelobates cultripes]
MNTPGLSANSGQKDVQGPMEMVWEIRGLNLDQTEEEPFPATQIIHIKEQKRGLLYKTGQTQTERALLKSRAVSGQIVSDFNGGREMTGQEAAFPDIGHSWGHYRAASTQTGQHMDTQQRNNQTIPSITCFLSNKRKIKTEKNDDDEIAEQLEKKDQIAQHQDMFSSISKDLGKPIIVHALPPATMVQLQPISVSDVVKSSTLPQIPFPLKIQSLAGPSNKLQSKDVPLTVLPSEVIDAFFSTEDPARMETESRGLPHVIPAEPGSAPTTACKRQLPPGITQRHNPYTSNGPTMFQRPVQPRSAPAESTQHAAISPSLPHTLYLRLCNCSPTQTQEQSKQSCMTPQVGNTTTAPSPVMGIDNTPPHVTLETTSASLTHPPPPSLLPCLGTTKSNTRRRTKHSPRSETHKHNPHTLYPTRLHNTPLHKPTSWASQLQDLP